MTVFKMISLIKEGHYFELNAWEKQFIEDLYEGVDGLSPEITDIDLGELLTDKQIQKVREIAEELGIGLD